MPNEEIDADVSEPKRSRKFLPYAIIAGLMLAEGLGIFVAMKTLGSDPEVVEAGEGDGIGPDGMAEQAMDAELPICELDAFNKKSGKLMMYHIEVVAVVNREQETGLKKLVELRRATIHDRITTVIRGADPKFLNEPGLETIRRQVKFELDKVFGDEKLINELLIPELLQSSSNL